MKHLGLNIIGPNYGFLLTKVPQEVLNELKPPVEKLKNNFSLGKPWNQGLAGEIEHEYELPIPSRIVEDYIKNIGAELDEGIGYLNNNYEKITRIYCSSLWVNFQKKYEYNPIHYHNGAFSFVIWYQIPYTFEEESKYSYKRNGENSNHGTFNFVTPNLSSKISNITCTTLDSDKRIEGYVAIFPSTLNHIVYPFYSSDDYRITVAGNIMVKTG